MFALRVHWDGKPVKPPDLDTGLLNVSQKKSHQPFFKWQDHVGGLTQGHFTIETKLAKSNESVVGLVWLGQLHNREALRLRLGMPERSTLGDVVFAAYEKWCEHCLNYFEGDFAFAIWDETAQKVLAARDPMGTHTLYFYHGNLGFLVSNDARQIALSLLPRPKLSQQALTMWVLNSYDEQLPLFDGIGGLAPAHGLIATCQGLRKWRYWDPWDTPDLRYSTAAEYGRHLYHLLKTSVSDRCAGEGVASMLSGGIDSAAVTALAAEEEPSLLAMTYKFHQLSLCDEWSKATAVTGHLRLAHLGLDAEAHWLMKGAMSQPWQEDPFLSWDQLTQVAMRGVIGENKKVLLTGHGGDNLFTGFSKSMLLGMALPRASFATWQQWRQDLARRPVSLARGFYRYLLRPKYLNHKQRMTRWPNRFPWVEKPLCRRLFPAGFPWLAKPRKGGCPQRQAMVWMVDDDAMGVRRAIHWYHRLGAPFGVAVRHPLFDRRLSAFMVSIPPEMVRMELGSKALFRQSMISRLPIETLFKNDKPSLAAFYYQGISKERQVIMRVMNDLRLAKHGLVNQKLLKKAYDRYLLADPNRALAWFFPTLYSEIWLRSAMADGFSL